MANSLYITATEARSGKSAISLGLMEMLLRKMERVGFFRPIITVDKGPDEKDNDIDLISSFFDLGIPYEKMYGYTATEAGKLFSAGGEGEVLEGIMRKYGQLQEMCDFVLCEGTDFASSTAAFELDINAEISKNLGSTVLLVANAHPRTIDQTLRSIELALDSLNDKGCYTIATIVNRLDPKDGKKMIKGLKKKDLVRDQLIYAIPEDESLGKPTVGEIAKIIGAEVLYGEDQLNRHVHNFTVAAMQLHNFLTRIERGSLIITPGDRADIIVACLAIVSSTSMENISGILLTGGLKPE
jgi:phosphate acetyltransferase